MTASGGPFRGRSADALVAVTPAEALAHPTWDMGRVITTNSATLVNKGLEVIEAHLLFDVPYSAIDVVVHPQSMIHSMVEFVDGSTIAQASPPDMKLPIALGLDDRRRIPGAGAPSTGRKRPRGRSSRSTTPSSCGRAREAGGEAGSTYPAVYNAANERAVDAFHDGALSFPGIVESIQRAVDLHEPPSEVTRESLAEAEAWAQGVVERAL